MKTKPMHYVCNNLKKMQQVKRQKPTSNDTSFGSPSLTRYCYLLKSLKIEHIAGKPPPTLECLFSTYFAS